jgi:hypothetical protein
VTTVALAGRRIDTPDTNPSRFPHAAIGAVEQSLHDYFTEHSVRHLVASAACGADLLALKAAAEAGIELRTIVLPFGVEEFRCTSVADRPGTWLDRHGAADDWNALYDRMVAAADAAGTLIVLACGPGDEDAYAMATDRIITEAARNNTAVRACVVWEGAARGVVDHSNALAEGARRHGWSVDQIDTCPER